MQVAVLFIIKFAFTATFTQIFCLRARPRRRLYRLLRRAPTVAPAGFIDRVTGESLSPTSRSFILLLVRSLAGLRFINVFASRRILQPRHSSQVLPTDYIVGVSLNTAHQIASSLQNFYSGFCRSRRARSSAFVAGATHNYRSPDTCRRCCPSTSLQNLFSGFCRSRRVCSSTLAAAHHLAAPTSIAGAAQYFAAQHLS